MGGEGRWRACTRWSATRRRGRDRVPRAGDRQPLADRVAADGRDPRLGRRAASPGAEVVPVVLPAFTDSRWFRAAFPDCVAYGFFPQRHQSLYETWPLIHGADERIDVRDLGFAATSSTSCRGGCWHDRHRPRKLRLGGMALRNGLLVHGPTHWAAAVRDAAPARSRSPPGASRALHAADGVPGVRGVVRLGEAFAVIPLVKRALPRGAAAVPGRRRVLGVAAGASLGRRARCAAACAASRGEVGRGAASRRAGAVRPARRRAGRLPRRRAQGDRRLRGRRPDDARDAAKEHERCGSHLVAPMLASNLAGTLLLRRALEQPGPGRGRRGRARLDGGRGRGVRVVRAQRGDAPGARAAAPRLRDPAPDRHARARRAPARGRPRGARRDPARRGRRPT